MWGVYYVVHGLYVLEAAERNLFHRLAYAYRRNHLFRIYRHVLFHRTRFLKHLNTFSTIRASLTMKFVYCEILGQKRFIITVILLIDACHSKISTHGV